MEFYDVGISDLRELWESYLSEPVALAQDAAASSKEEEWGNVLCLRDGSSLGVVLRDRLMTDAALGGPRPIKSEHSYSLLASSPPASPATPGVSPRTPNSGSSADMEEECFPAILMNAASSRGELASSSSLTSSSSLSSPSSSSSSSSSSVPLAPTSSCSSLSSTAIIVAKRKSTAMPEDTGGPEIKCEPVSAPASPCAVASRLSSTMLLRDEKGAITMVSPRSVHFGKSHQARTSDSEDDDEDEYYQDMEVEEYDEEVPREGKSGLPPTPPSSASSDSEGTASASCSPKRRDSQSSSVHVQNLRGLLAPRLYVTNAGHTTRQPIHTPLISCQPKGSTGILTLTEEEKRTLMAEGYPVPTKLPLTKQEEKSLKKVRRKIKNKISAQESRRKKKEYMDGLERRVTLLTNENSSYRDKLTALEDTNRELLKELQRLQTLLQQQSS
ncbi:hypothetical protein KM043_013950 [Ampulex compressa]|nr:hypothetical protein KM043_013950 [Ampulex compressa]